MDIWGRKEPSLHRGMLPHKAGSIPLSFAFISSQEHPIPEVWESVPLQSPLLIGLVRWPLVAVASR